MRTYQKILMYICIPALLLGIDLIAFAQSQDLKVSIYQLSLDETTEIALKNNFDIQLTKYDTWIARTEEGIARSIYDTIFQAQVEYRDDQQKRTSTILGTKTVDNDYNIGLSKKLPVGTTLSIDLDNNRNFNNATFATASLTHDSTLGVTVEQDLGKNFLGIQDRGNIKITLIDIENAEYTSLEKIEASIAQVQKAYWDLVLLVKKVGIEEDMVSQAKKLYDLHQDNLESGLVEIPEAIASEANYKSRKNTLLLAYNQVQAKNNVLKLLLNIEGEVEIEPTEDFSLPTQREELLIALNLAFDNRQDYKVSQREIDAKDIALSMKKNNLWPEINLMATLERNGLGDHFKQAVIDITDQNNPNFFAGISIEMPLENREARADWKAAKLQKAKSLLELKLLERKIAVEITDGVRDCNIFQEVAANSQEIALLQKHKLKEEIKRFRYGRSDTDTLIRFQEDYSQAENKMIIAIHQYYIALVDLSQKEGTLLKKYWDGEI